jgi:hypothetical protein
VRQLTVVDFNQNFLKYKGNTMRKIMCTFLLVAVGAAIGCEPTVVDRQADAIRANTRYEAEKVRESTQAGAEVIRDQSQAKADAIRDANGKTIFGTAKDPIAERVADRIEASGEEKADALKNAGESKADRIEEKGEKTADKVEKRGG